MSESNSAVETLYRKIMKNCRDQRRSKTTLTNRQLAKLLEVTENYLSAFENSRKTPSIKLFLNYLVINGFDTQLLEELQVTHGKHLKQESKAKISLVKKINELPEEEIGFLSDIVKALANFRGR